MKARLVAAAALAFSVLPGAAGAQTVAETLAKWGLTGIWSADCDRFPSDRNTYLRITTGPDGRSLLEYDSGDTREQNEIVAAEIAADLSLTVRIARERKLHEISYVKAMPRIMRVFASHDVGGDYTVKDGNIVGTREATLWQIRCY
jgi:hypothetical protein